MDSILTRYIFKKFYQIKTNNSNYYYIIIHIKMENHIQFFFEKLFIPLIEINKCVCELVYNNKNTDSTIL